MCGNYAKIIKVVMSWKPTGKRSQRHPRKRWLDVAEKDLKRIGRGS